MSAVSARDIVEAFKKDKGALAELAGMIAGEPDIRLVVINAVLRDVATREYMDKRFSELRQELVEFRRELVATREYVDKRLNQLEGRLMQKIAELRQEFVELRRELGTRIDSYLRWTVGLIIVMWTTTLIPLLLRIVGVI